VKRNLEELLGSVYEADYVDLEKVAEGAGGYKTAAEIEAEIRNLTGEMLSAAEKLDFEHAAALRDRISRLRQAELGV
jgi:excinuclease UvrABC helicase subunit UvrB